MKPKKAISLFAGIEGFGLAAHKSGWEVVASVEWEQFPQLVIKKNFPNTEIYGDIKQFDGRKFRGTIDIICGGFPCQPYSLAGKRQGKDDDRHLWPEMLRVIQEIQPTWVIGENVPGLVNWSKGVVFEEVQSDLETEGYEVQSFILPAAGVGAPHRRDRVWIVAYSASNGHKSGRFREDQFAQGKSKSEKQKRERVWNDCRGISEQGITPDTPSNRRLRNRTVFAPEKGQQPGFIQAGQLEGGFEGLRFQRDVTDTSDTRLQGSEKFRSIASQWQESHKQSAGRICTDWQNFPTQSPICNGDDGVSAGLVRYILRTGGDCYTEEEAEKEAKRIISKVRAEGIKAGGNAIVHQVALQIFNSINEFEKSL